jgi:hypothetical protein
MLSELWSRGARRTFSTEFRFQRLAIYSARNEKSLVSCNIATVSPRDHVAEPSTDRHGWFIAL